MVLRKIGGQGLLMKICQLVSLVDHRLRFFMNLQRLNITLNLEINVIRTVIVGGILPGNKLQSYLLRSLIRRTLVKVYFLTGKTTQDLDFKQVIEEVFKIYDGVYLDYEKDGELVEKTIKNEADRFSKNLEAG